MKFNSQKQTETNRKVIKLIASAFVFVLSVSTLFISFKTAHAGLSSFISSVFGSENVAAKTDQTASVANIQTISILQAATNLDPNPIKTVAVVPVSSGTALDADIALAEVDSTGAVNTQISTYVVQGGDTISSVAAMFGVSSNTVLWANNLTGKSILKQGQTLVILPISGATHTVKKGDSLQGIAKKYGTDIDDILAYNDLTISSVLNPGDSIIVPNAEIKTSVPIRIVAGTNPAHHTSGPSYSGYYTRPITGGRRTQDLHGYNGVDLADKIGTPIYASAAGKVIVSRSGGYNGGYGTFIIISHNNGTQTLYAHNSKNLVSVGEYVEQGEKIALMGSTGKSTGSHLHFEIRGAKNPF